MTAGDLLNTLDDLIEDEFELFKWYLQQPGCLEGYQTIKASKLDKKQRWNTVNLMVQTYTLHGALKVTKKVLEKINRNDLVESLPNTSSGPEVSAVDVSHVGEASENRGPSSSQDLTLRVDPGGARQLRPSLRKYSCELTFDTNTVNRKIELSDNSRKVTHVEGDQSYPDHPDRFDESLQLLCRTGLTGRCYWEVEWEGCVFISVSYRGISRKGSSRDCLFGENDQSWSLECTFRGYGVWHNKRNTFIASSSSSSSSVSYRVGVYVDYPAGTLSFYRVSSDTLIHIHTFNTTFTEPLYPGFGLRRRVSEMRFSSPFGSSVSLCSL